MREGKRITIFSPKRVVLSIFVGFMCPMVFLLTLFVIFSSTGKSPSQDVMLPVTWPKVVWDVLIDQPRSGANVAGGLLVMGICDTAVYGAITYLILTAVSVVRPTTATLDPPPTPEEFHPGPPNSD